MDAAIALLADGKPARLVEVPKEDEALFRSFNLLTAKPILYVANVEEAAAATGNALSEKVEAMAEARGRRLRRDLGRDRIRDRAAARRRAERIPRDAGARRARPRPADPRRLRAPRPHHLLHRRAEGSPRLDDSRGRPGAAGGRHHPHRFREGLHPRPDHRLRRLRRARRRTGAPRTPARRATKARNTSSRTAT